MIENWILPYIWRMPVALGIQVTDRNGTQHDESRVYRPFPVNARTDTNTGSDSRDAEDCVWHWQVLACRSHSKIYEENGSSFKQHTMPMSTVYEDDNACLKFATAPKMSPRTKHIDVKYHFFWEKVEKLEIQVIHIDSDENAADTFTKGLPEVTFQKLRKKIMGW
jgi:hypothetical protein